MSCNNCGTDPVKKMLDDMAEKKWDEVKALAVSAKRLRVIAIVATVISVICLCLSIWLTNAYIEQNGKLKAIQDILDAGVVIEETTTTETTQTVDGDSATINNVDGEQYNDSAQNGGE